MNAVEEIKVLLADSSLRIKLYDKVVEMSRLVVEKTSIELFPDTGGWDDREFAARLPRYEEATADLTSSMALLGFWGTADHHAAMAVPAKHFDIQLGEQMRRGGWVSLRWYPLMLGVYAFGIGAVAGHNYEMLHGFLGTPMSNPSSPSTRVPLVLAAQEGLGPVREAFRALEGREGLLTASSEYLFDLMGRAITEAIFLGQDFEESFDRFELLFALQHAHEREKQRLGGFWGPVGRFGWKFARGSDLNPVSILQQEVSVMGPTWPPLRAGFFDGSRDRYQEVAAGYLIHLRNIH